MTNTHTPQAAPQHPSTAVSKLTGFVPYDAVVAQNHFKFKSLSDFAFNTSVGCMHKCKFCYVPSLLRQPDFLHKRGVKDPDAQWGDYQFVRNWDVKEFLASLHRAENTPLSELSDYGKRVIILCSTTDAYSVLRGGNLATTRAANAQLEKMVREALELILTKSTLNVRILTRSPLAERDFDLMKRYGNRLLFGMSIPTLNDKLARVYEPGAPAPTLRLRTLQRAKAAGIPVYIAMAPTPPECTATDLRTTLSALKDLDPVTIFHEPINIRAENAARIATYAAECGVTLHTGVFDTMTSWRAYAVDQLRQVEAISKDLGVYDRLHLWPDANLKTAVAAKEQPDPEDHLSWVESWHNKVSAWPC
jgi:DNA repair photolyase